MKNLLGKANIEGYFTNHSLRRTGGSHLFQAGIERKIVKEITGHVSDVIDSYQLTSDEQRQACSEVLAGRNHAKTKKKAVKVDKSEDIQVMSSVSVNRKKPHVHVRRPTPQSLTIWQK